jgi:hypothetical protein
MQAALQTVKDQNYVNGGHMRGGPAPDASAKQHPVLALQQQAGNQAAQELLRRAGMQAKLAITHPNDPEEREADQVAERVMRMHGGAISSPCSCAESGEMCEGCHKKQQGTVARKAESTGAVTGDFPFVSEVLHSPGEPLDSETRAFFEPRFGVDFSSVRVHRDATAAVSARSVNALAFTAGPHTVFNLGQYQPSSLPGRRLLAHELAHVVQQTPRPTAIARQQGPSDAGLPGGVSTPPVPQNPSQGGGPAPTGSGKDPCVDDCERKFNECLNPPWWKFWKTTDSTECLAERSACESACSGGKRNAGKKCINVGSGGCSYNDKTKKGYKRCSYNCEDGSSNCSDENLSCGPGNWDPPCPRYSQETC